MDAGVDAWSLSPAAVGEEGYEKEGDRSMTVTAKTSLEDERVHARGGTGRVGVRMVSQQARMQIVDFEPMRSSWGRAISRNS